MKVLDPWLCCPLGLGYIGFAFLLVVGSGMEMHVEHDDEHFWIVVFSTILALLALILIGVSLWPYRNVPLWRVRSTSKKKTSGAELE